jgi:hypothetical protein
MDQMMATSQFDHLAWSTKILFAATSATD